MNALTLHICACGPIETRRVFTRYEPEDLTVHTNVLVCTVTFKLAQSIDAIPVMLARVGRTFININITPVSKKNPTLHLFIYSYNCVLKKTLCYVIFFIEFHSPGCDAM